MPTKPTVKPKWAEDDVVDPSSGQTNVVEPPEGRKNSGWNRREIPPRQWFNWLHRFYYRWIDWLDGTTIPLTLSGSSTNTQEADGTGHTHAITVATQVQAEGGANTVGLMTPQRDKQAFDFFLEEFGYATATVELGGDFLAGNEIKITRVGNQVTITSNGNPTHSSSNAPTSAAGVIPSQFRTTAGATISNVYHMTGTVLSSVRVTSDGILNLAYLDWAGGSVSRTSSPENLIITYNII